MSQGMQTSEKRLSGKRIVRETSVREIDCPGNVCYPIFMKADVLCVILGYDARISVWCQSDWCLSLRCWWMCLYCFEDVLQ